MLVLLYDKNRLDEWYWADFFSYIQYALLKAYFKIETIICRGIMPHGNKFLKAINLKLVLLFPTKSTSLKFSLLLFLHSQQILDYFSSLHIYVYLCLIFAQDAIEIFSKHLLLKYLFSSLYTRWCLMQLS